MDTRNSNTPVVMIRLLGELAAKPGTIVLLRYVNESMAKENDQTHLASSILCQDGFTVSRP